MSRLDIRPDGLFLDGEPFDLQSGSFHYFRTLPGGWRRRLQCLKDFGLNTVQTYCAWNLHEPQEGQFRFDGHLNLRAFLELCREMGLWVLLRPSPFINSECDNGGLPWWLLRNPSIGLRSMDPDYLAAVRRYYHRLCAEFVPMLSTKGGPILAVCLENEYGCHMNGQPYLRALRQMLQDEGVDVPFYTTDGNSDFMLAQGRLPEEWAGVNYRIESREAIARLRRIQPDRPALVGEYWAGRASRWGEEFSFREVPPIAKAYREALDLGAHVNFYMFAGGTSFGFFSGARTAAFAGGGSRYRPMVTSYDVDALVGEDGNPREKYYACRRELSAARGLPEPTDRIPPLPVQSIGPVPLAGVAPLFGQLTALSRPVHHSVPLSMEQLGVGYGYALYRATLPGGWGGPGQSPMPLRLQHFADRAAVYADGRYLGAYMRDAENEEICVSSENGPVELSILVENTGRLASGLSPRDYKGLWGDVTWGGFKVLEWDMYPLPMEDLSGLAFTPDAFRPDQPAFLRCEFSARPGVDAHLDVRGFGKGFAVLNGFNLGRYWQVGPQQTLYVPGELLHERNELILFEQHAVPQDACVRFADRMILDGPVTPD